MPALIMRRIGRWAIGLLSLVAVLLAALVIAGATTGITLSAAHWRVPVAAALSAVLGREAWLQGPMTLRIGWASRLRLEQVHVRNPVGFDDVDALYLSTIEAQVALLPWLRSGRLHLLALQADEAVLKLAHDSDGRLNWADTGSAATPKTATHEPGPTGDEAVALAIDRLRIARLQIDYQGVDGHRRHLALTDIQAHVADDASMHLSLRGLVDDLFAFDASLDLGSMASLQEWRSGRAPWPLAGELRALGATLTAEGAWRPEGLSLRLGFGAPEPARAAQMLGIALPPLGPAALVTHLDTSDAGLALNGLSLWVGDNQLQGDLAIDLRLPRPRLSGELSAPVLDLATLLRGTAEGPSRDPASSVRSVQQGRPDPAPPDTSPATESLAAWYQQHAHDPIDLTYLRGIDADLKLQVGEWPTMPGELRQTRLHLQLVDGLLQASMTATVAGVQMQGDWQLDGRTSPPRIELSLGTADTPLGQLASLLFGLDGVQGALGGIAGRIVGQGDSIAELAASLDVYLAIARGGFTYGNQPGQRPVAFTFDSLAMQIPAGGELTAQASGSLLDQPLSATLDAGRLVDMLATGRVPLDLRARSRSVRARLHGLVGPQAAPQGGQAQLTLELKAAQARDAAAWLGFSARLAAPLAMGGRLVFDDGNWVVSGGRFAVGRSGVTARVSQTREGSQPLLKATIEADSIDVRELQALFARAQADVSRREAGVAATSGNVLDIPVLPAELDLTDTDLSLSVTRVQGTRLDIRDLAFDASIRDGNMAASPLRMSVLGVPMRGALALDLRGQRPGGQWWLFAQNADVGSVLRRLGLSQDIEAIVDDLNLHLQASGQRLGDLLDNARVTLQANGGQISVGDRNTGQRLNIGLDAMTLGAEQGAALAGQIRGSLQGQPVQIELGTAPLAVLVSATQTYPFEATMRLAGVQVALSGQVGRSFGEAARSRAAAGQLKLQLRVQGERLDGVSDLVSVALPEWGPYEARGTLVVSADGYEVPNLDVTVGQSRLEGSGSLLTRERPPRLTMALRAPAMQLDDFRFGRWQPFGDASAAPGDGGAASLLRQAGDVSRRTESLFSPAVLRRLDVSLRLGVDQLYSGEVRLGSAELLVALADGKAVLGPLSMRTEDGSADARIDYMPTDDGVGLRVRMSADRFDYGLIARRLQSGSDLAGHISLRADLASESPSLSQALAMGNGRLDFMVQPQGLQSGVFDLWATNLFIALASRVDPDSASRINCGIGRFNLRQGRLLSEQILLDTTRVRVDGQGVVDFGEQQVNLRMEPLPKRAEFFSLATPLEVSGGFEAFEVSPRAGDIAATAFRLLTSVLWVPAQKLLGRTLPRDGSDVCRFEADAVNRSASNGASAAGHAGTPLPLPRERAQSQAPPEALEELYVY